jgi:uncharacterized membrane protein YhaH (DUF805 family)
MGPIEAIRTCLTRYATFSGRARRPEFWWFALALIVSQGVAATLDAVLFGGPPPGPGASGPGGVEDGDGGPVSAVLGLATIVPALAAGWRRMHDVGRSGWWSLLHWPVLLLALAVSLLLTVSTGGAGSPWATTASYVPIGAGVVAYLYVLWLLAQPSEPRENRFGPEPAR